ncbi:MAG TPA: beta-propeller fold lactonase family protein, partial [Jatrophihabitans sp.]|nr:beta-propeller fold lactonase family protein [Jatrophihabitans sp.]
SDQQSMGSPTVPGMIAGHLYLQTNELTNGIIHYARGADGTITELERVPTGGGGSGGYNPIVNRESTPNPFEGASSVILSPDSRFLFTTNAGDNSVSSFSVSVDGKLTVIDVKRTGNVVAGKSGSAKSLQYDASTGTLFVLHSLGPDHVRLMSVDDEGRLTARPERYTVNTPQKPNRVATMVTLSPDGKFLIVGTTFDEPAKPNPDGSPILWVSHNGEPPHSVASNAPDPDGLVVFPVNSHGALGNAMLQDGGGGSPWFPLFLNNRPNHFVIGYAVADGLSLATLDSDGKVATGPVAKCDTSAGLPSEMCWLAISPDDKTVYATNFGYSYITTYRLDGNVLSVAKDPACPKVPGDGRFRALNGTVSSGPSDNWLTPDGAYLYQIYGNASKLIGYRTQPDGMLEEVTSATIPYNSSQGLAGF